MRRREQPAFHTHGNGFGIGETANAKPLGELLVRAHHGIEHAAEAAQMAPEPAEPTVNGFGRRNPAEPAVGVSGERVRMHHQRATGPALPAPNSGRARPGRRRLDMVRPPEIESAVQRLLVIEIAIAAVDRQLWRRYRDQEGARSALDDLVALARSDDHHFVAEACRKLEFRFDIGAHPATDGGIEGAYVDDPHWAEKARNGLNLK